MKTISPTHLKKILWSLLLSGSEAIGAVPAIEMGEPENYCVIFCYVRAPFKITNYGPGERIGRVFCELEADVTAALPVYKGETKTKNMKASPIGVFKSSDGEGIGDVEMNTGIAKKYFHGAKVKKVNCHF